MTAFLTAVFSFFSRRCLAGTRSVAYGNQVPCKILYEFLKRLTSWLPSLDEWIKYGVCHAKNIKHKELLSVGQTPSSILIGVVHWRLTNLRLHSFTAVTNYVSDGGNSAGTRSLHLWDTETYNLIRASYWCRILHFSPTTWHDSFYDCTPFVSGREHSARN